MTNKILILGNGMLGKTLRDYFISLEEYEVITIHPDGQGRFPAQSYKDNITKHDSPETLIINGVGQIPQKGKDFSINYELPKFLVDNINNAKVINISTDCVFSGKKFLTKAFVGNNNKYDELDAAGEYGLSKIKGEQIINGTKDSFKTIRTSIIGLGDSNDHGLLCWFLTLPKNSIIRGFSNHFWQGLTTLELSKFIHRVLSSWGEWDKLIQVGSKNIYSKYELLQIFRQVFKRKDVKILFDSHGYCNRSLVSDETMSDIEQQLIEFKKFYKI